MKNTSFSKIAFSFALVAVMLVLGSSILTAQPPMPTMMVTDCPANECPPVVPDGYSHIGLCTFDYGHCVLQCYEWEKDNDPNVGCYSNCNWQ